MPVDYDRDTSLPLRVPPEVRARLDAVRSLAPAWAPLSRNGAAVAALMLGLDALETALRADPTAAARLLAGETITTSPTPARPAAAPATARPEVDAPTVRDLLATVLQRDEGATTRGWTVDALAREARVTPSAVALLRDAGTMEPGGLARLWSALRSNPPTIEPRDTSRDRVPPPSRKARAPSVHVEGDDAALRARLAALLAMEPDKHPRDRAWNLRRIGRAIGADNKSLAAFRDAKPGLGPTYRRALAALLDEIDAGTVTPSK